MSQGLTSTSGMLHIISKTCIHSVQIVVHVKLIKIYFKSCVRQCQTKRCSRLVFVFQDGKKILQLNDEILNFLFFSKIEADGTSSKNNL